MLWECMAWAFRGSIALSAAWAPVLGTIVLWAALYMYGLEVVIPDNLLGTVAIFLMCAGTAWFVIFTGRLLYAPYHFLRIARTENRSLRASLSHTEGRFKLSVGETGKFLTAKASTWYDRNKTFNLKVENIASRDHPFTQCKVILMNVSPGLGRDGPWPLLSDFSLAAGDHRFVPLVQRNEPYKAKKSGAVGDTIIVILTAEDPLQRPLMPISKPHVLSLRATGFGAHPCDFKCKVWVDDESQMRIDEF